MLTGPALSSKIVPLVSVTLNSALLLSVVCELLRVCLMMLGYTLAPSVAVTGVCSE